jgi:nicotinamide-nucleotide amidase
VPVDLIETFGAVSRETAQAMASGALVQANVDLAVAITGIAGPGGAMPGKPVGLVYFAAAARGGAHIHQARQFGDIGRAPVRHEAVRQALAMLRELADQEAPPPAPR